MSSHPALIERLTRRKHAIMAAWEQALHRYHGPFQPCPALRINVVPPLFDELVTHIDRANPLAPSGKIPLTLAAEHGRLRALTKGYRVHDIRQEYALFLQALDSVLETDTPLPPSERDHAHHVVMRAQRRAIKRFIQVRAARRALRRLRWRVTSTRRQLGFKSYCSVRLHARQACKAPPSERQDRMRHVALQHDLVGILQPHQKMANGHIPWEQIYQIVDYIPHPVFTVDAAGAVNYLNARWYNYTGLSTTQSLDHGWKQALRPDMRQAIEAHFERICADGKTCEFECELRGTLGYYRWYRIRMWAITIPTDRATPIVWLAMGHDIHHERMAAQKAVGAINRMQQAHQQARAAVSHLEQEALTRERFVALLGHDLRNPLNVAQTCCERLLRQPDRSVEQREPIVRRIMTSLERTDRMIGNLLDAYRLQRGGTIPIYPVPTDLRALIAASVASLTEDDSARFAVACTKTRIDGLWDEVALGRVFDNLCSNALKYGAPQTPITICITTCDNEDVLVAVHNQGEPIAKAQQEKIFAPFERAGADGQALAGWGLGLVLVRGIVEAHQGCVWVDSAQDTGTTFWLRLPQGRCAKQ